MKIMNRIKEWHKNKLISQISLSYDTIAVILGSILGDGSLKIYKGYKNARISIRHSYKQLNYMNYKISLLKEINNPKSLIVQKPTGFSKEKKLLYQSKSHEELTKIYNLTYKNNKLIIKRKWLNHISPLGLAIWWLDDGSIISYNKGVFCTDGFELKSVQILSKYLKKVWGIENRVRLIKKEKEEEIKYYPRIFINKTNLLKLIKIIEKYVPEEIKYKITINKHKKFQ